MERLHQLEESRRDIFIENGKKIRNRIALYEYDRDDDNSNLSFDIGKSIQINKFKKHYLDINKGSKKNDENKQNNLKNNTKDKISKSNNTKMVRKENFKKKIIIIILIAPKEKKLIQL